MCRLYALDRIFGGQDAASGHCAQGLKRLLLALRALVRAATSAQ
jgi:hypothetical protein